MVRRSKKRSRVKKHDKKRKKIHDPLGRVMRKVARGEKLTKKDREILSTVTDALMKKDKHGRKKPLEKVMSKVAKSKKLTKEDREILSAAIDAVKGKRKRR